MTLNDLSEIQRDYSLNAANDVFYVYLRIHALVHLHSWIGAYKTGKISETVEDKESYNGLLSCTRAFDCRQNV